MGFVVAREVTNMAIGAIDKVEWGVFIVDLLTLINPHVDFLLYYANDKYGSFGTFTFFFKYKIMCVVFFFFKLTH